MSFITDDMMLPALLNERATRAAAIGKLKANGGAYRPEREAEVLRRIALANRGPLANDALVRLFTEIMSACRALEQPLAVAYLGPQGTFSEMALAKQFGTNIEAVPCGSIDDGCQPNRKTGADHDDAIKHFTPEKIQHLWEMRLLFGGGSAVLGCPGGGR